MNTVTASRTSEVDSPVELCPADEITEEDCRHVSLRLQGTWDDIMAALEHWKIEWDRQSGQTVGQNEDECVVYGTLKVGQQD